MNSDILATIPVSPDVTSAVVTVPLSPAQAAGASFGCIIEISPDGGAHWFFGASSGFQGPDLTNRDGSPRTQYQFSARASALAAPPTHVRVRLVNPSDPTLSPSIAAS